MCASEGSDSSYSYRWIPSSKWSLSYFAIIKKLSIRIKLDFFAKALNYLEIMNTWQSLSNVHLIAQSVLDLLVPK